MHHLLIRHQCGYNLLTFNTVSLAFWEILVPVAGEFCKPGKSDVACEADRQRPGVRLWLSIQISSLCKPSATAAPVGIASLRLAFTGTGACPCRIGPTAGAR